MAISTPNIKDKSMVAALRPFGEVALMPREFPHSAICLEQLVTVIIDLGEDTRVIMEATGRYHEPIATALHKSDNNSSCSAASIICIENCSSSAKQSHFSG